MPFAPLGFDVLSLTIFLARVLFNYLKILNYMLSLFRRKFNFLIDLGFCTLEALL